MGSTLFSPATESRASTKTTKHYICYLLKPVAFAICVFTYASYSPGSMSSVPADLGATIDSRSSLSSTGCNETTGTENVIITKIYS